MDWGWEYGYVEAEKTMMDRAWRDWDELKVEGRGDLMGGVYYWEDIWREVDFGGREGSLGDGSKTSSVLKNDEVWRKDADSTRMEDWREGDEAGSVEEMDRCEVGEDMRMEHRWWWDGEDWETVEMKGWRCQGWWTGKEGGTFSGKEMKGREGETIY